MDREEGEMVIRRAEIDTRAPFRSVKEAVMLFGERVLAGEIYANKLKELASINSHVPLRLETATAELEETRQSLQKAREEGMLMEKCLSSLRGELEETKKELQQLKANELEKKSIHLHIEDLKFVENVTKVEDLKFEENATKVEVKKTTTIAEGIEFQKKRYVTFANPPCLAKVISPEHNEVAMERHPSLSKKKKKILIPLIGGIFSKMKGIQEPATPNARVS